MHCAKAFILGGIFWIICIIYCLLTDGFLLGYFLSGPLVVSGAAAILLAVDMTIFFIINYSTIKAVQAAEDAYELESAARRGNQVS